MTPKVSVCIPVYNGEEHIGRAIESVLAQDYADIELLVLDNASTDGTASAVGRFSDPRLTCHRNETNVGFVGNLNRALARARGEYVVFLCADDVWRPGFLSKAVQVLDAEPSARFVFSGADIIGNTGSVERPIPYTWKPGRVAGPDFFKDFFKAGGVVLSACLCRRGALLEFGGFDENLTYAPDAAMWLRQSLKGDAFFLPEPLAAYRIHPSNLTRDFYRSAEVLRQKLALIQRVRAYPEYQAAQGRLKVTDEAFRPLERQFAADVVRMRMHGARRGEILSGLRSLRGAGALPHPVPAYLAFAATFFFPSSWLTALPSLLPIGLLLVLTALEFLLQPRVLVWNAYVRLIDVAALLALAQVVRARSREEVPFPWRLSVPLLAAALLSLAFSFDPRLSIKKCIQLSEHLFLAYYAAWALRRPADARYVVFTILGASLLESLLAAGQYILNIGNIPLTPDMVRVAGTLGNSLAPYLLLGAICGAAYAVHPATRSWKSYALATALILNGILLTQVRSVVIFAAGASVLLFTFLPGRRTLFRMALMAGLSAASFTGISLLRAGARHETALKPAAVLEQRGVRTVNERVELWKAALRMFRFRPWTGVGIGTYGKLCLNPPGTIPGLQDNAISLPRRYAEFDAHSDVLTQLAETGVIGVLALCLLLAAMLAWAVRVGLRLGGSRPEAAAVATILALTVGTEFVFTTLGGKLMWLMMGVLWRLESDRHALAEEDGTTRPLKVVVVTGSLPPMRCGVGDYTRGLATALSQASCDVRVTSSQDGDIAVRSWNPLNMLELARRIAAERPGLVHIQYPTIGYGRRLGPQILALWLRVMRIPLVTTVHEYRRTHLLRRLATWPLLLLSDYLIFTNVEEREAVACMWPAPLRDRFLRASAVIPVGSNVPAVDWATNGSRSACYFGLFYPGKNVELVVRAFRKAADLDPELRFTFIGDEHPDHPRYFATLRSAVQSALPQDRVDWLLAASPEDIARALAHSSVCVLPYPDGASFKRTTLIAALSAGVPIVTTRGEATPSELIESEAVRFGREADQLGEETVRVAQDKELSAVLSTKAKGLSRAFTWERIANAHVAAYNGMLSEPTIRGASQ